MIDLPRIGRTLLVLVTALALGGVAAAQPAVGAVVLPAGPQAPPSIACDPVAVHPTWLEVKLAEGCGAELVEGRLVSRVGVELDAVQRWFAECEAAPLCASVSWEQLDRWHRRACEVLPEHNRPGHLGLWFRLRASDEAHAERLRTALAAEPLVEHVYLAHRLFPASAGAVVAPAAMAGGGDPPPATPSWASQQVALSASPNGHGVRAGATVLGARGRGVGFYMIEDSWYWGHEDLSQVVQANVVGPIPPLTLPVANHGIAGAGIAFADRNCWGITGVADEVDAHLVWNDPFTGGFPNAVAQSMQHGNAGDVILCVVMILVPSLGPGTWLPLEFLQANFDATLTATANGRHVVIPAGNGNRSLDDPSLLGRFDRSLRDSGAIIVGASAGANLQKAPFSNWGSRIDAHSHGDGVITCGYGTLFFPNGDPLQAYTAAGTGTSSATPHIAGLVAALVGGVRRQTGQLLTNQDVLDLLHSVGPTTPDVIGRRPDLEAMLQQAGAFDGLTLAEPDLSPGDTIAATIDGPSGALAAIFGSFVAGDVSIGLNRDMHLDPTQFTALSGYVLGSGGAQYTLPVPNIATLQGVDVFFQAVRFDPPGIALHLTNSCQVTIL